MNRRKFCTVVGIGLIQAGCSNNREVVPPEDLAGGDSAKPASCSGSISAGAADAVASGDAQFLSNDHVFLCRDSGGLYALTSVCTHQGCDVNFVSESSGFACPCHGAQFNFDGGVTQGPAQRPLVHYAVCVDSSGDVTIDPSKTVSTSERS